MNNRFARLLKLTNQYTVDASITDLQQSIVILPGCTGSLFDQQTLGSIVSILNLLNINAIIPDKIMCCGALAQHSGHSQQTEQLTATITNYLYKQNVSEFVSFASGCGRQLNDYVANDQLQHKDIISWLANSTKIASINFDSLPQRVLIHMPCTLEDDARNNLTRLLKLIPGIQLLDFNDGVYCCGAGGMQLISPEDSNSALVNLKINTIRKIQPDIIISSNVGCSLNLKLGLQDADLDINVIHPVTLLAQQLKN
jgi:glycolate oxidase iron-sulfur subunit